MVFTHYNRHRDDADKLKITISDGCNENIAGILSFEFHFILILPFVRIISYTGLSVDVHN